MYILLKQIGAVTDKQGEAEQSLEENSNSTQALDSIIQDSVSPLQEESKSPEKSHDQAHTSEAQQVGKINFLRQQQEIDRNILLLNSPVVIDSNTDLHASQLKGINLQVELNPRIVRKTIRSKKYEDCMNSEGEEHEEEDYVSDTQEHEEELVEEELQFTKEAGTILGIEYVDTDIMRMKKMIQNEAEELKLLRKNNTFAPLQRY